MILFTELWKFSLQVLYNQKNKTVKKIFLIYFYIFLLFCLLVPNDAQFNPCNGKNLICVMIKKYKWNLGKAQLGEACDRDFDCDNKGSVCLRGACSCHPNYMRVKSEKGTSSRCVICNL